MSIRKSYLMCLFVLSTLFLMGCAPEFVAGNNKFVTIRVPKPTADYEGQALAMADAHCKAYGKTANLRKPRSFSDFAASYDYSCVK